MRTNALSNFRNYLLFAFYFLLYSLYRCCEVGEVVDFDGSCKSSCTGATVGSNCADTDCALQIANVCITCIDTYYKNNQNQCIKCTQGLNCNTCSSDTVCLSCIPTYYLKDAQCVLSCGDSYYQNVSNGLCQPCTTSNCKTCSNSVSVCDVCLPTYYYDEGNCVSSCTGGKYIKGTSCVTSCGSGYYIYQGVECKPCDSQLNCDTCSIGGSSCLTCIQESSYKYNLNGTCVITCGNGYFGDSNDSNKCKQCTGALNCSQCVNDLACTVCASNYYMNSSNNCVTDCGLGYFKNTANQTCTVCNSSKNCESCVDNNTCSTCNQSGSYKYLMPTQCATSCGNGYYALPNNNCTTCDVNKNCKTCTSNGTICDSCDQTGQYKYMKNNTCLASCGDFFYGDGSFNCQPCNSNLNCKTCGNPYTCDSCPINTYLKYGTCVSSCGEGFYANEYNECNRCTKSLNCKTCVNESSCSSCNTASEFAFFYNNQCLSVCPDGYFSDNYICKTCSKDLNCKTCNNSGNTCLSCTTDSQTIPQKYLLNGTCVNQCGNGYYTESGQFNCIACVNGGNCLTCNNSTNCLTCDTTSANRFLKDGLCVFSCGEGMYGDASFNCTLCNPSLNCKQCTNGTSCSQCNQSSTYKYLKNSICVESCGSKFYADGNNNCIACSDSNCLTCPSKACSLCDQSTSFKYLRLNSCQTSCGDQYYPADINNTCASCEASMNCKTCNDLSACTSCYTNQANAYLQGGICQTACLASQYADDNKVCIDCNVSYNCLTCNSVGCLTCSPGKYLQSNRCVDTCSDGYYLDVTNTFCLLCDTTINCKTCSNDGKKCLTCSSQSSYRFLQDNKCVVSCGDTYYPDPNQNNQCTSCNPDYNCKTCNDATSCTSCDQGGLYKYLNGNKCVMQCDNGQFPERYQCVTCLATCKTCEISTQCTSCDSAGTYKYLKDNQCVESCGLGYYQSTARTCVPCQASLNCKTCSQSTTQCDSCYQDSDFTNNNNGNPIKKYLYNGQCLTTCGSNAFPNNLNVCQSCPQYCSSCSQPNKCDVCQQLTWKSDEGICYKCNVGEIVTDDGKKCLSQQLCSKNPLYVVNSDNNMCIKRQQCIDSAQNSYVMLNGTYYSCSICLPPYKTSSDRTQCLQSCPAGEITNPNNANQCLSCTLPLIANQSKTQCIEPSLCVEPNIISEEKQQCILRTDCLNQDNSYIVTIDEVSTCKICSNSVISNNKTYCLAKCPDGQYQINNKKTCQLCQSSSSSPQCSCLKNVDSDGNCVDSCPAGQYINSIVNTKQCQTCTELITSDKKQCVKYCPSGQYLNSPISTTCIPCNGYVSQNGFSCIKSCSKITDLDNKKCLQDQQFCPNLLSLDGTKCSKYCVNGEVQIQDSKQCAQTCPSNYIRDIRNFTNICIPTPLCIGFKSSDNSKCVNQCSDILEIQNSNICTKSCPNNQFKIIQNDFTIACIDQNDAQMSSLYQNSLQNFKKILSKPSTITQEYIESFSNELNSYVNKLQDIVTLEKSSSTPTYSVSSQSYSDLLSLALMLNDKSYNNQGIANTFSSSNAKITTYKLQNDEILITNINYKDFINTKVSLVSKNSDTSSNVQNVNQIQVSYLKQNIFCKDLCSDNLGYFKINTILSNTSTKRLLQSGQTFQLTFNLDSNMNIQELTCVSIINNTQVAALNTTKTKSKNTITCTFSENVFLVVDPTCKYQDVSNCKSDSGQSIDNDIDEEEDSGLSSGAVAGLVIGILLTLIILGVVGFIMYRKRKNLKSKTKYQDSNNQSKTVDQEHLKNDIKSFDLKSQE